MEGSKPEQGMVEQSHLDPKVKGHGYFPREAVTSVPWMVTGKLVLFFFYFGISVLTVNGLGKEQYGVYTLFQNIASYLLMICGLGLGAALSRYIPELAARKNRFGLVHLLWKSATLQAIAVLSMSLILVFAADPLQRLFNAEHVGPFKFYLLLACVLTGLLLFKDYVGTVFTAFFKARTVSVLAVTQGAIWFLLLASLLHIRPTVGTVLSVQLVSVVLIYSLGALLLFRYVMQLDWSNDEFGIGKKRTLSFSGTVMLSSILRMVMFKFSEVFFIAAVGGTTLAGIYDLGYTLPYTLITFIPLSLVTLFSSAFADAYSRDEDCLGILIHSYYKLLIMVALPVGTMGFWFAPTVYRILYGGEMNLAGDVASVFSLLLLLPLISMPLSAAIKAKEKVLNMVPMLLLQIVVNLLLDWLLIVQFKLGVWGGVGAVAGTFILTIPFRLLVVRRIIGGVYFPLAFFLRVAVVFAVIAGGVFQITQFGQVFEWSDNRVINVLLLFAVGGLCMLLFMLSVRYLRLVREDDVNELRSLQISKLEPVIQFFVR
jgi:O-antigen/teichoic acid export membrane protein